MFRKIAESLFPGNMHINTLCSKYMYYKVSLNSVQKRKNMTNGMID